MSGHDLIVIGGSAGGVEAVSALLAGLPADLPAAVCVVVHQPAYVSSRLSQVFGRAGPLPAVAAAHGMALEPGTVYVAVPDQHLLVVPGALRLTHGPKENRHRPAVDPLFRSAALAYGARVIGVVLSGALDDGTAGLWAVRDRGGVSVVQDPADALIPGMPTSALSEVGADYVSPASALGALLGRLSRAPRRAEAVAAPAPDGRAAELEREVAIASLDEAAHQRSERYGVPSRFSCPDCSGVLWDLSGDGGPRRFRCETGHAYSAATLAESQADAVEEAMWMALRTLEDRAELARVRAAGAESRGLSALARRFDAQLDATQEHAMAIRAIIRLNGRAPGARPAPPADAADGDGPNDRDA